MLKRGKVNRGLIEKDGRQYRKLHGSRSINEKSHACLAKYL